MSYNYKITRGDRIRSTMGEFMKTSRLHRSVFEKTITKNIGVHHSQHLLLMIIARKENQTQKMLAHQLEISPAAVAVTLRKLEAGGYIERSEGKYDHRSNTVTLSEKGRSVAELTREMFSANDNAIFEGFSDREIDEFCSYIDRIKTNLTALNDSIDNVN